MKDEAITTDSAAPPVGHYPHARRAGPWLYLSGLGPRDPITGEVPGLALDPTGRVCGYDFEAQCHGVFNNVRSVLAAAGGSLADVIDVTVFLIDIERDFATFNRLFAEYFRDDPPCRTTVEVSRLPTPIAVELKCIAWLAGEPRDDAAREKTP